jgi:hypothetical protein
LRREGRESLSFRRSVFHFDRVARNVGSTGWAASAAWPFRHPFWLLAGKLSVMLTVILFAAGLLCFALFFKSIDYFEKI